MLDDVAHRPFFINGKTAASIAHAEMVLIRAEDKMRCSAYRATLEILAAYLEAASFSNQGDLNLLFSDEFEFRHLRQSPRIIAGIPPEYERTHAAFRYIHAIRWISQHISPNQKITPEMLLDLHSYCLFDEGHHQSNVRFRRKDVSKLPRNTPHTVARNKRFSKPNQENAFPLVLELCEFINKNSQSPLAQAAIAHYQFASIKPFEGADDCTCAAMTHAVLFRRGILRKTIVPLSLLGNLQPHTVDVGRFLPNGVLGEGGESADIKNLNAWIGLCAASIELAADSISSLCDIVEDLEAFWKKQLGKLSRGSLLEEVLCLLPSSPIITVECLMQKTGRSFTTVNDALARLEGAGILSVQPIPHQRTRIFKAHEALNAYKGFISNVVPPFLLTAAFRSQVYQ